MDKYLPDIKIAGINIDLYDGQKSIFLALKSILFLYEYFQLLVLTLCRKKTHFFIFLYYKTLWAYVYLLRKKNRGYGVTKLTSRLKRIAEGSRKKATLF